MNIEPKVKQAVQIMGLRHAGVYMRGYNDIINESDYEKAIEEMKKKLERMSHLLDHYTVRVVRQEEMIKELEGKLCFGKNKKKI